MVKINMKMPKCCAECNLLGRSTIIDVYYCFLVCLNIDHEDTDVSKERARFCPLMEVQNENN